MVENPDILKFVEACAARLREPATVDAAVLEPEFRALVDALATLEPRFFFDREGRPGAVHMVREALPATEQEILDAIVEDHAHELAAVQEAMFQIARACVLRRAGGE